jgi:hypothetical protein
MKSLKTIMFLLASFLFVNQANSQCPTNPLDCPLNPFIGPFNRTIELTPTCSLRYEYCWRVAECYSSDLYDLFIGKLELIGSCGSIEQDILDSLGKYLQYCHNDVVANVNPWGVDELEIPECCPPSTEPCWTDWTWRQGNYACYTEWYWDSVTGYLTIDKCDVINPQYCWDKVRYCFVIEYFPSGPPKRKLNYEAEAFVESSNCPEFGGINEDLKCHPACD